MKDKYGVKKTTIEFEGMKEDVFYLPFVQTDKFFQMGNETKLVSS